MIKVKKKSKVSYHFTAAESDASWDKVFSMFCLFFVCRPRIDELVTFRLIGITYVVCMLVMDDPSPPPVFTSSLPPPPTLSLFSCPIPIYGNNKS